MLQNSAVPVFFLGFANAEENNYLKELKRESAALRDLLLPLDKKGCIKLLREESTNNKDIPKLLTQYKDEIAVFHYAGHADGQHLEFEDQKGHLGGLAKLLGLQKNLKLVFLNGCITQAQARPYLQAGIPAVIATTRSISDDRAVYFSERFYDALATQHSIQEAFTMASGALKAQQEPGYVERPEIVIYRSFGRLKEEEHWQEIPWRLYVWEGKEEALDWRIPKKKKKWIWQLTAGIGVLTTLIAYFLNQPPVEVTTPPVAETQDTIIRSPIIPAQSILKIEGKVKINRSGVPIKNASVTIENTPLNTETDQNGYFSLTLDDSSSTAHDLIVNYPGYNIGKKKILFLKGITDTFVEISLQPKNIISIRSEAGSETEFKERLKEYVQSNSISIGHIDIYFSYSEQHKRSIPDQKKYTYINGGWLRVKINGRFCANIDGLFLLRNTHASGEPLPEFEQTMKTNMDRAINDNMDSIIKKIIECL